MNRGLVQSAVFAVGVHGLLFVPVNLWSPARDSVASTDVFRGANSLEVELQVSQESAARPDREIVPREGPEELPPTGAEPARKPEPSDDGALRSSLPCALQNPAPRYPLQARIRGWEGTVLIQAWVAPSGGAGSARVIRSSGHAILDQAALAAVKGWRFQPARRGRTAVDSVVEVPITFRLEKRGGLTWRQSVR